MSFEKRHVPKKSENISDWYNAVVLQAELADYGPAKGTMIFRPYGYAMWEELQKHLNREIKLKGVQNAYFPLFIPESFLNKEKEHVKGFSPELAVVTIGGGEELKEKLVVRPTSETIMYDSYSKWIQSWRDLPLMLNQWNNVVRWEKRTYLFLRTTEFLWQEGHTAHASHDEAWEMVQWGIETYAKMFREYLAMPGFIGRKSSQEKFAGADVTLTYESLMPDGKALQASTSHDLGQNFAKSFDIGFTDQEGKRQCVWQTSWGLSTRAIGGMILSHGDDRGLKIPPKLAPVQVVILPVKCKPEEREFAKELFDILNQLDVRVLIDDRADQSLGFRINKWELKGVPLRLEIGSKEVMEGVCTLARRDRVEKTTIAKSNIQTVSSLLETIQEDYYRTAEEFLKQHTHEVNDYEQFKAIMNGERGFLKALWCENTACETKIKEETKATTRCLPLDAPEENGSCVYCGKPAKHRWVFAQAY